MAEAWRSEKVRRTISEVQPVADRIAAHLEAQGVEFHFGGSFRRQAPTVGDLDVVIVRASNSLEPTLELPGVDLPDWIEFQRRGEQIAQGDVQMPDGLPLHIDFWVCTPAARGAFLWFITGPKELNVAMRVEAIRRGLNLSQVGLFRGGEKIKGKLVGGEQVDKGTEYSVAWLLGGMQDDRWIRLLRPEARQFWAAPKEELVQQIRVPSSSGKGTYVVTYDGYNAACTCPGYKYRGSCKHSDAVRESGSKL